VFRPGTAKYQELIVELLKMQRAKIDAAASISKMSPRAAAICCTCWPRWCWPLA
jgi:hypothetical protein